MTDVIRPGAGAPVPPHARGEVGIEAGILENPGIAAAGPPRAHLGCWKRAEFGKQLFDALTACAAEGDDGVSARDAVLPGSPSLRSRVEL